MAFFDSGQLAFLGMAASPMARSFPGGPIIWVPVLSRLPQDVMSILEEGEHFSRSGFISQDRYEREADTFAAGLLMPLVMISPLIKKSPAGFDAIRLLSESCESSLVASSIRYCEVTDECVAVVVARAGVVEFMVASSGFRRIPEINWLRKSEKVPVNLPTSRLGSNRVWVGSGAVVRDRSFLNQWFPKAPRAEMKEEVVGLGSYGRTLTILVPESVPDSGIITPPVEGKGKMRKR